jgi:hypothetical protein
MDRVMVFGFFSAFTAMVLIGYRGQLKTGLPVIAASMVCCTVYGFLANAWPLGFVLALMTCLELRTWRRTRAFLPEPTCRPIRAARCLHRESRLNRLFGPT